MTTQLKYGLSIDGKTYKTFDIKPLTIGNELKALAYIDAVAEQYSSSALTLIEALAYMAPQIIINAQALTPEQLIEKLHSDDFIIINEALAAFAKKPASALDSLPAP